MRRRQRLLQAGRATTSSQMTDSHSLSDIGSRGCPRPRQRKACKQALRHRRAGTAPASSRVTAWHVANMKDVSKTVDRVAALALDLSKESQRSVSTYYDSLWGRLRAVLAGDATQPLHLRLVHAADGDVSVLREARSRITMCSDSRARRAVRLLDSAIQSIERGAAHETGELPRSSNQDA